MKKCIFFLQCVILVFLSNTMYSQTEMKINAKIEKEFVEKQVKMKAFVTNEGTTYQELNYLFIAIKKGSTGNLSNNKQSGKFTLNPSESKVLSEIGVSLENNDALKAYLYIRDEETQKLITKDSLEINNYIFNQTAAKVEKEARTELSGLIIDETKTKTGRDFFDFFYIQYNQLPSKSDGSITIAELPTQGTGSQIHIMMDDKVIYSFTTSPSEDYLREQAANSFIYIKDYNSKKNLIKNEFIY